MEARKYEEEFPIQGGLAVHAQRELFDRDEVLHKKRRYWAGRRAQDIVLSSIALLVLWPFMLLLSLAIVLDSPGAGPIFYQERIGRDGKRFRFYNLRWME